MYLTRHSFLEKISRHILLTRLPKLQRQKVKYTYKYSRKKYIISMRRISIDSCSKLIKFVEQQVFISILDSQVLLIFINVQPFHKPIVYIFQVFFYLVLYMYRNFVKFNNLCFGDPDATLYFFHLNFSQNLCVLHVRYF